MLKYIKEIVYENKDTCPFKVFEKTVKKFPIPSKYVDQHLLGNIFNQYKDPNKDEMNYIKYLNYIFAPKDNEDFYDFQ